MQNIFQLKNSKILEEKDTSQSFDESLSVSCVALHESTQIISKTKQNIA